MSKKEKEQPLPEQEEKILSEQDTAETQATPAEDQPDYYEKYVRLSADFENFRRRTEREKAAFLAYGKKDFVEKLLPAYEVLLRQQAQMEKQTVSDECAAEVKSLLGGIKMVLGELDKAFKAEGIEKMDVIDTPYDPMKEECIATIPSSSKQDGMVLEEVQMGFMMDGKVLRPARVVVGKAGEEA
ncbi:MAG: nucleotide exchange factor GrpE [Elusimicrobiaceae bacterium]|nr:nucleotide exchange factor GrpE [Elusimicrobiaceae bacterium]